MFYRLCLSRCCYVECCKALERVEDMAEEWGAPQYSLWMDFVTRLTFHDPKVVFFCCIFLTFMIVLKMLIFHLGN